MIIKFHTKHVYKNPFTFVFYENDVKNSALYIHIDHLHTYRYTNFYYETKFFFLSFCF